MLLGCELSAEHDGWPVHVLGYGFDPDEPAFAAKRAWIAEGRVTRTRRMVERLRALGAPVELERVKELAGGGALGRPHVARAMVEAGVVDDVAAAFSPEWIGTGGRAYVGKDAVTPVEAVELIHGAGGVAVLAHPSVHAGAAAVPEPVIRAMAGPGWTASRSTTPTSRPPTGPAGGPGRRAGPGDDRRLRLPRRPLRLPPRQRAHPRRHRRAPPGRA